MEWDTSTQEFKIYSPRAEIPQFTEFNDDKSYFIYVTEDTDLIIEGSEPDPETRNLVEGWNSPSYPYRNTISLFTTTTSIETNLRYIMKWDNILQLFKIYSPKSVEPSPFSQLSQGEGMFINMYGE